MTLKIGDKAPEFKLETDEGQMLSLQSLAGKKVVLYFYPKDNTPGCTREACDFRDNMGEFAAKNAVILGVSKDSAVKHKKFKQQFALPFTLLADINGDVCEAYGVLNKKSLFGKTFLGIERRTFLIDEHGIIKAIWPKVKVTDHIQKVINELN